MQTQNSSSPFPAADGEGCIARNIKRIAHMDIAGGAQIVSKGNLVFISHMLPPHGTSIIDVSDHKNPSLLASVNLDGEHSHSHKVVVAGDLGFKKNDAFSDGGVWRSLVGTFDSFQAASLWG